MQLCEAWPQWPARAVVASEPLRIIIMHGTSKALLVMALACSAGAVAWTATDAKIHDAVRLWLDDRAAGDELFLAFTAPIWLPIVVIVAVCVCYCNRKKRAAFMTEQNYELVTARPVVEDVAVAKMV